MTIYPLVAAACLLLAVLLGGAGLVYWIGQVIDDRHRRRPYESIKPGPLNEMRGKRCTSGSAAARGLKTE
ncbi:hypothetical protein LCGC14_0336640 [marine sediment metagenome]|uniref:Uncharacterized protein n=1 Tax=marine sediment metagenome TaxID=412755 RepID=A0A0F9TKN5_9ZZZZ